MMTPDVKATVRGKRSGPAEEQVTQKISKNNKKEEKKTRVRQSNSKSQQLKGCATFNAGNMPAVWYETWKNQIATHASINASVDSINFKSKFPSVLVRMPFPQPARSRLSTVGPGKRVERH